MIDMELIDQWLEAKSREQIAQIDRRQIEDKISKMVSLPIEGTTPALAGDYIVKIKTSLTWKVDSELLQEVAHENGLDDHIRDLFRWKPEIDKKKWEATDKSIIDVLSAAVTAKPARPNFTVELKKEK